MPQIIEAFEAGQTLSLGLRWEVVEPLEQWHRAIVLIKHDFSRGRSSHLYCSQFCERSQVLFSAIDASSLQLRHHLQSRHVRTWLGAVTTFRDLFDNQCRSGIFSTT